MADLEFTKNHSREFKLICETLDYLLEDNELNPLLNLKATLAQLESICSFPGPNQRTTFTAYSSQVIEYINNLVSGLDPEDDPLPHPEDKEVKALAQINLTAINSARDAALAGQLPVFKAVFSTNQAKDAEERSKYINTLPGGSVMNKTPNTFTNIPAQTQAQAPIKSTANPIKEVRNLIAKEKFHRLLEIFNPQTAASFSGSQATAPPEHIDNKLIITNKTAPAQRNVTSSSIDSQDQHAIEIDKLLYQLKIAHKSQNPVIPNNPQQYRELPTNDFNELANAAIREIQKGLFTYHKDPQTVSIINQNIKNIKDAAQRGGQFVPVYLTSENVAAAAYANEGPSITKEMLNSYFKEDTTTGAISTFVKPLEEKPIKRTPKSFLEYAATPAKSYQSLLKKEYSKNTHNASFPEAGFK